VNAPLVLENDALRVAVDPTVGGAITAIEHKATGASVLGTVPWTPRPGPATTVAAPDEISWLPYYTGGWPVLFPNGGDACTFDGVFHGFHGEASLAAWEIEQGGTGLRLRHRFATVPVEMARDVTLEGETLVIRERIRMLGDRTVSVMWGHHPTFGSDLLEGPFEIGTQARRVMVDDRFDSPVNPLQPGASGPWPNVPGKHGSYDFSRPHRPVAAMAYLADFESPSAWIRRLDDAIGAVLAWDGAVFPYAWLWCELGGTPDAPWNGKAHLIGIEPNTTWPGNGLLDTHRRGAPLLQLRPGESLEAWVSLTVTKPGPNFPR
jgi:galactose mutarotase-like enzyme